MTIIINGEIVADDDPRAIARRGKPAATAQQQRRGSRIATFGDLGAAGSGGAARGTAGQQRRQSTTATTGNAGDEAQADGPLTPLSRLLKIEGRRILFPPIPQLNFAGFGLPWVCVVVALAVALFTGNARYAILALVVATMISMQ